jgi:hypothetical protein
MLNEIMGNMAADPMADAMGAIGVISGASNMAIDTASILPSAHASISKTLAHKSVIEQI